MRLVLGSPVYPQVIARIVDGSRFDEFKAFYGDTLVTGGSPAASASSPRILPWLRLTAASLRRLLQDIRLPGGNHRQQRSVVLRVGEEGKTHKPEFCVGR